MTSTTRTIPYIQSCNKSFTQKHQEKDKYKANEAHCSTCADKALYSLCTSLDEDSVVLELHQVKNQHSDVIKNSRKFFLLQNANQNKYEEYEE